MGQRIIGWMCTFAIGVVTACGGAAPPAATPPTESATGFAGQTDARVISEPTVYGSTGDVGENENAHLDKKRAESPPAPPPPAAGNPGPQRELMAQVPAQVPSPVGKPPPAKPAPTQPNTSEVVAVRGPMLVYTAQLTMAVFEVGKAIGAVEELARDVGGFLARRDDRSITIRVPVARFDEAIKRISTAGDVIHRDVRAEDVTEEFHDLEIRLKNLRAVRDRLEQLLARAAKVEESLLIERELDRVAAEIDRIEGRMKFLRDRASFSTITATFQPRGQENVSRPFNLPVPWLQALGLGRLLSL
jgi:hypothetical protein